MSDALSKLHKQLSQAQADIQHVASVLTVPLSEADRSACLKRAERAIGRLQLAAATLSENPASLLGRIGGQKTAERGPDYFRKIAAMRTTRGGGRPKKQPENS